MNVMTFAHAVTRIVIAQASFKMSYKQHFKACMADAWAFVKAGVNLSAKLVEMKKAFGVKEYTVSEFAHSRATRPEKETKFLSFEKAKAYMNALPAFSCACMYRPDGGQCATNFPNPYNPIERAAAIAFNNKATDWPSQLRTGHVLGDWF